ncbi:class I SAM-dependent methyltransferase [Alphaproteobacteria bacterium]|nr:class I SAM-dependent methyltransferase [Alphaproteobacteria bacterium]
MLKLASCDSQGSVYIGASAVYRPVVAEHANQVQEVLQIIGNGIDGVIETVVCEGDALPSELKALAQPLTLQHRKVAYVSYPHEWCAAMLQDAAVFHLALSERLLAKGLTLKDAHPWNILFDCGQPVFVDFTSLTTGQGLFAEEYLEANRQYQNAPVEKRRVALIREIFARMYQPYFLNPLTFYACGERYRVRFLIENTTLNASTSTISLRECLPSYRIGRSTVKKVVRFFKASKSEKKAFAKLDGDSNIGAFYADMRRHVESLPVAIGASAYSAYYSEKGEDHNWSYSQNWSAKQKSVHDALNSPDIFSVLDVACNTGWFSLMAEKLGKSVVAFDIDEACIETLYTRVRDARLNVLPLVMNFTQLTQDRYSIHDGNKVLINAVERLRSDSVIALGIIHHLVLGLGLSFDEVLDPLIALSKKQLVIEFVDANDAMIQKEPEFFPAYCKNRDLITAYDMQALITKVESQGYVVDVRASHPETRKMLVCNRRAPA